MTRDLFKPGDWIDRYEIVGRLRAGGMATLFLGRRHGAAGVSKPVAIKVIHPHLAEDELIVNMFIDEARISSQISHSNVVYIETFGEHDGIYYIVMEYVDGCSLQQVLKMLGQRREQLAPAMAAHLVIEAAAGLHAAHATAGADGAPLGIVHRDVSPSNVLLARDGRVKLIDFGIAKARNRLGETRAGSKLKGKLAYMAPEQAWGKETDPRTDVYALGVVLWELITARPLFRAEDEIAMLELVRAPDVPPPSRFNPDVSLALDAVVSRALAKQPEHRLQTAADLRRELTQAVPQAAAMGSEVVALLVARVRETLGVAEPEDMKPTTPVAPSVQLESAVRTAAGEIAPAPARQGRRWLALGGGLVAVAGIVGGLAYSRMSETTTTAAAAVTTQPKAALVIDAAAAPAPPPPPPTVEPLPALQPPPPPVATTKPAIKRPRPKPAATTNMRSLEVDGAVLADKPGAKKATTATKSRDAVKVGDEVLVK